MNYNTKLNVKFFWARLTKGLRPLVRPGYPLQSCVPLMGGAHKYFRFYPSRENAREPVSVFRQ